MQTTTPTQPPKLIAVKGRNNSEQAIYKAQGEVYTAAVQRDVKGKLFFSHGVEKVYLPLEFQH